MKLLWHSLFRERPVCVTLSVKQWDASRSKLCHFEHVSIACPHLADATMRASAKVSEAFAVLGLEEVRS